MDLDVDLGGSWWILTWILVDLDVDLGGSWWILGGSWNVIDEDCAGYGVRVAMIVGVLED